jgi:gliding motility-associated lipoprotein GldK
MKRLVAISAILTFFISCGSSNDKGELVGARGGMWYPEKPYGMTLIPGGSFIMGKSDVDLASVGDAPTRTVTVRSFYMDETEITNREYRQFVEWVKDSTIRVRLAIMAESKGQKSGKGSRGRSIAAYAFDDLNPKKMTAYDKYMSKNYYSVGTKENPYDGRRLNRRVQLITNPKQYPDEAYVEVMDSMYLSKEKSYKGMRTMDVNKLKFSYSWMDIHAAAKAGVDRSKDFLKSEVVKIYPDTTAWIKDFSYSYNEPMHNDYFWHQAYGDYPVVGVNWYQAKAFCAWRTLYKNAYIKSRKINRDNVNYFRLPSESEWEYSARGGLESATYPWGGPYTRNERGQFLANFKPSRGDYAADKSLYTVEAKSFEPNGYNLYNMAGNVSEWTDSSYDPNSYDYVSSMNPNTNNPLNKRKVVRGGSWKDVSYYLQVSTRDYEYADSARSYIGFRTVQDYMGTVTTGKNKKNK